MSSVMIHGDEPPSVQYFRTTLTQKTKQLEDLCNHWSGVLALMDGQQQMDRETNGNDEETDEQRASEAAEQEDLSGAIRTTIGQAKLLMSQRFKQFSDLIDNCEFNTGQHPTTLNDLSGFWEMIGYQIDDVSEKFKSLKARCSK